MKPTTRTGLLIDRRYEKHEPGAGHPERPERISSILTALTKAELTEYLTELTQSEMKEYYRGNLWPNTPDILHEFLVTGGLPAGRSSTPSAIQWRPSADVFAASERR